MNVVKTDIRSDSRLSNSVCAFILIVLFLGLSACGSSTPNKAEEPMSKTEAAATSSSSEKMTKADAAPSNSSDSGKSSKDLSGATSTPAATKAATEAATEVATKAAKEEKVAEKKSAEPEVVKPLKTVQQCKKEPYTKYENAARASIKKGWQATKEEKFGVGFRNSAEYKKWGKTHNDLFKTVSATCENLSACAKKHGKNKMKKCAAEAKRFNAWQISAEKFTKKVKSVEYTQPPVLCSIQPSSKDPSECYSLLADRINDSCVSGECLEVATCFQGLGFLDDAINQAESACKFVHQKLSKCRGYVEATGRRQSEFDQCAQLYKNLEVEIIPVL